jgi:anaerobic magnesium-protoporphyrin IX monomethyl ester cyclase
MKILFLGAKLHTIEPFGVMSLAPYLEREGHEVLLMEAEDAALESKVRALRPDVVGYSVCTGSERYYLALNRALKAQAQFISVFGGPHPTFFPGMIEEPGVDAICRGEGELAFAEFCRELAANGEMKAVPNFSVKVGDKIRVSPPRPLVPDADAFPFPSRELYYRVSPEIAKHTIRSFLAARGCPFACSYCFNPAMDALYEGNWKRVRTRSPENLVGEIVAVARKYPTEFVAFRESIFPLREEWLREFAELYTRRVALPFYCHLRLDMLTDERVALLAKAGCYSVNVGIETGNAELREKLLNRRVSNETMINACALLRRHGIKILANNMLGLPGASFEHDLETLALNQQCKPDYALAMLWQPYPGTELAEYARRGGYYTGAGRELDFTYYNRSHLKFASEREKRRIENFQKLFAVGAALPLLTPLIRLLTRLPQNAIFKTIFRVMYLVFHSEIFKTRRGVLDWTRNFRHIARET